MTTNETALRDALAGSFCVAESKGHPEPGQGSYRLIFSFSNLEALHKAHAAYIAPQSPSQPVVAEAVNPMTDKHINWLVHALEAWPGRPDPEKTTNITYLMQEAAKVIRAHPQASPPLSVKPTYPDTYSAFTDGMMAAAEICGSLAETTYDDADGFEAATGCEAAIMAVVKQQRKEQAQASPPPVQGEKRDTVTFVQEWMMSGDHEPDQWTRDFAAAIDARLAHSQTDTQEGE